MNCTLANCTAGNNGQIGFFTGGASTLNGCSAGWNGSNGFVVTPACRLANCTAFWNEGNGFDASWAGEDVAGCKISGCTAGWNKQIGIIVTYKGSIVENCAASWNTSHGIYVGSRCYILANSCDTNGWCGIHVNGSYNRIEGNSTTFNNGAGIVTVNPGNNCIVVRNSSHGNMMNFSFAANTWNAKIYSAASVPPLVQGFAISDPWANFDY